MKKFICLIICLTMSMTLFFESLVYADRGGSAAYGTGIGIGDYIQLGKYNDKPILWRYVLDDENGKLMLSDKVLCEKTYYSYRGFFSTPSILKRVQDVTETIDLNDVSKNYWGDSAIRSWLNSKAPAGKVDWLNDNPPKTHYDEKGFLADGNFSQSERMVIKKVRQKSILDVLDRKCAADGSQDGSVLWNNFFQTIDEFIANRYDKLCYEYTEDMMFLLDAKQVYSLIQNKHILGDEYFFAERAFVSSDEDPYAQYFLRTPYGDCITKFYAADSFTYHNPYMLMSVANKPHSSAPETIPIEYINAGTPSGIRPAFYLDEKNAVVISGAGTRDNPYVIAGKAGTEKMEDEAFGLETERDNPMGISIYLDGKTIWSAINPYVDNGTIFVPSAWAKDAFDLHIWTYYDYISISTPKENYSIRFFDMYPDGSYILRDGTTRKTEPPYRYEYGVYFLPLRAFSEMLGIKVEWIESEKKVLLTSPSE